MGLSTGILCDRGHHTAPRRPRRTNTAVSVTVFSRLPSAMRNCEAVSDSRASEAHASHSHSSPLTHVITHLICGSSYESIPVARLPERRSRRQERTSSLPLPLRDALGRCPCLMPERMTFAFDTAARCRLAA